MKRTIGLVIAMSVLAACSKKEDVAYKDVQTCKADIAMRSSEDDDPRDNDPQKCQKAYDEAMDRWRKLQGYSTQQDCSLGQGGECVRRDDGTWMSPMVGFFAGALIGNALSGMPVTIGKDPCATNNFTPNKDPRCNTGSHSGGFFYVGGRSYLSPVSVMSRGSSGYSYSSIRGGRMATVASESFAAHSSSVSRGGFGRAGFAHGASGGE